MISGPLSGATITGIVVVTMETGHAPEDFGAGVGIDSVADSQICITEGGEAIDLGGSFS